MGTHNFARRAVCFQCGATGPDESERMTATQKQKEKKEPAKPKLLKEKIPAPPSAGPLSSEYCREDDGTDDVDVDKVYAIIEKRRRAQKAHDFITADKLRKELREMNVHVNDRLKVWAVSPEAGGGGFDWE